MPAIIKTDAAREADFAVNRVWLVNHGGERVSAEAVAAADRLRIDAATAEVLRALDRARIRHRLLKGPALADWYGSDLTWSYLDCDLWIHPHDLADAEHAVEQLGFRRDFDERTMPGWWREHASSWTRVADGVTIDVHRKLQGTGVDALTAWEILGDPAEVIDVAGCRALRLPEAARALYIVLHAAHHGRAWGKALVHLEKALDLVEGPVWQHASDLAARLDALDAFVVGLRLLPKGTELASALELRSATSAEALLHSETPPPTALGFAQLAKAASTRERAAIAARKMFPPPAFIRHWWTPARRSRRMLIIGYAYRQLWLVTHARRGLPAWLRARQRARR